MPLPTPDPTALEQSTELTGRLRQEIDQAGGSLPFSRFMALALYADDLGYYSARSPFGPTGDFVTAPLLSPLFAQCLARTCQQTGGDIVEYGAGSGALARDLLSALAACDALPEHYWIIETSARCRAAQSALLADACPDWVSRVHWVDKPPAGFRGVILANELLDALPFDCFRYANGQFEERRVGWENHQFVWQRHPVGEKLAASLALLPPLPEGYQSEIRPELPAFVGKMASSLQEGLLLLIDYGYGRRPYFHPDRAQGTLTCFYRHHRHANPFCWPGLQDMTAHVDFTAVAEGATDAGLALTGFTTQAAFLLGSGLSELARPLPTDSAQTLWERAQAIKTLTLPNEMGDIIKVIGFSPDPTLDLPGFSLKDCRQDL